LAIDIDHNGYITVEEMLKFFGNDSEINFADLKKIIMDKDSNHKGKLGFTDFSKWLGSSIHMSEGFYFRHDSIKNPIYEMNRKKDLDEAAPNRLEAVKSLLSGNIEKKVIEKIMCQWKTVRKAFMDMNSEKDGNISKNEFKYQLDFWGLKITDEQFEKVFNKFDVDGDGLISYKDFQMSIGADMFPAEGLYFRQDIAHQNYINACEHKQCFQPTVNKMNYCEIH
jgi:Ca2+-binding EF-hand superfamily protein